MDAYIKKQDLLEYLKLREENHERRIEKLACRLCDYDESTEKVSRETLDYWMTRHRHNLMETRAIIEYIIAAE